MLQTEYPTSQEQWPEARPHLISDILDRHRLRDRPLPPSAISDMRDLFSDSDPRLDFAGDNFWPAHPEYLQVASLALSSAGLTYQTGGRLSAYTNDLLGHEFHDKPSDDTVAFFTPSSTASNILGITPIAKPAHAIISADIAHLNTREAGAQARTNNMGSYVLRSTDGKIRKSDIEEFLDRFGNDGGWTYAGKQKPTVISITQPSEYGTLYTDEEVRDLADFAHQNGMLLHMDGARLFYAAAAMDRGIGELTSRNGVDIVAVGGSKCGMALAEAVVYTPSFFKHARGYAQEDTPVHLFNELRTHAKQTGIAVGQSFAAAGQFAYALERKNAARIVEPAINAARTLEQELQTIEDSRVLMPVETNIVFMSLPSVAVNALIKHYKLMGFPGQDPELPGNRLVRFMTNVYTDELAIQGLMQTIPRT